MGRWWGRLSFHFWWSRFGRHCYCSRRETPFIFFIFMIPLRLRSTISAMGCGIISLKYANDFGFQPDMATGNAKLEKGRNPLQYLMEALTTTSSMPVQARGRVKSFSGGGATRILFWMEKDVITSDWLGIFRQYNDQRYFSFFWMKQKAWIGYNSIGKMSVPLRFKGSLSTFFEISRFAQVAWNSISKLGGKPGCGQEKPSWMGEPEARNLYLSPFVDFRWFGLMFKWTGAGIWRYGMTGIKIILKGRWRTRGEPAGLFRLLSFKWMVPLRTWDYDSFFHWRSGKKCKEITLIGSSTVPILHLSRKWALKKWKNG